MNRSNPHTVYLMDTARAAQQLPSDYRLARMLGVQTSNTTAWRKRGVHMSDEYAAKCAELAGLDPVESVLRVTAERQSGKTAEIMRMALVRLSRHTASILLGLLLLGAGLHNTVAAEVYAQIPPDSSALPVIYYAKYVASWLGWKIRTVLIPSGSRLSLLVLA